LTAHYDAYDLFFVRHRSRTEERINGRPMEIFLGPPPKIDMAIID